MYTLVHDLIVSRTPFWTGSLMLSVIQWLQAVSSSRWVRPITGVRWNYDRANTAGQWTRFTGCSPCLSASLSQLHWWHTIPSTTDHLCIPWYLRACRLRRLSLSRLCSADRDDMVVPRSRTARYGPCSFPVAVSHIWNMLPERLVCISLFTRTVAALI